jgi:hypothetical protein
VFRISPTSNQAKAGGGGAAAAPGSLRTLEFIPS